MDLHEVGRDIVDRIELLECFEIVIRFVDTASKITVIIQSEPSVLNETVRDLQK